jgi:AraC-like DNA-binding protein
MSVLPDRPGTASIPNANGTLTRQAYARGKAAGVEVKPLMDKAGLTQQQVMDTKARLPVRSQMRFVGLVAEAVNDDLLGFHLARDLNLREIGLLYYAMASSDLLSEALRRAARYSSIVNEGFAVHCLAKPSVGVTAVHWVGQDRQQSEALMAILVRICRALTRQSLLPESVRFVHVRGTLPPQFPPLFGDNIAFGANADELLFPEHVRDTPVASADPYLNTLLLGYCDEALARRHTPAQSFRSRVEHAVAPLLPHGRVCVDELARGLGVSRRTFARKLAAENVTFRELLECMRQDLAQRHLADRDLSISQIAWLVGYQEVGAFSHAFRRWTGKSPRAAR